MELIYATLLLHKAGKEVSEENIKKILNAAGVTKDEGQIKALVSALKDMNIEEAIKEASVLTVAAPAATAEKPESKKEAEKEQGKPAEAAAAGLSSLFG
ncbi:MAG: 50S ribosomal protein P1 [Nanoarchaeota archaeon]|nr:50S ribosomal protein P1 [Nanoarchaeota archaeon]